MFLNSEIISLLVAGTGLALLARRLLPLLHAEPESRSLPVSELPFVSIIVPARNEEHVLPALLDSLTRLDYPSFEVIVVDDQSNDRTFAIASEFGGRVRAIRGQERSGGWHGKQWACHQGAQIAEGEILLFTDADTIHYRHSLKSAVSRLRSQQGAMLSAIPYHDNPDNWERLLGPFQLMLLAVTGPAQVPRPGRVFCVGQYLMFERSFYQQLNGHAAVSSAWVEDVPLANLALRAGGRYVLDTGANLFRVRMYTSLAEFIRGWRRNFRAGLGQSAWWAPFEIGSYIAAITGAGHALTQLPHALIAVLTIVLLLKTQPKLGRFSAWGPVLSIWSIILFCLVTGLAVLDMVWRRELKWKGRSYAVSTAQS